MITLRLVVEPSAPIPHRAGAIDDTHLIAPVSGMTPPDRTTWIMVTTTRAGMVCSDLVTRLEIARPMSMETKHSTATAIAISTSGALVSSEPVFGIGRPARPMTTMSSVCTTLTTPRTSTLEER